MDELSIPEDLDLFPFSCCKVESFLFVLFFHAVTLLKPMAHLSFDFFVQYLLK